MRCPLPLAVYCISLLSLRRLQALPAEERPGAHRLDLLSKFTEKKEDNALLSRRQPNTAISSSGPRQSPKWLPGFLRHPPASGVRAASPSLAWLTGASQIKRSPLRVRRHAHSGSRGQHHSHHAQLMRVGCVLGTCQVQNLSHRLYQLIGQSGRQDSSPINPRSPHSYG